MKIRHPLRKSVPLLIIGIAASGLASHATAGELPKRKPGLWEITTQAEGMPSMGAIQHCIDKNSDDLMQQQAAKQKPDCSVMESKTSGNKVSVHSVCRMEGSTVTTDGVFEGSFESNYKGTVRSRFNPPMHGIAESNMTQEARWVGPCKPGQKPGDVIMPNVGGMDINEMMKDPKIQEMMKRQK